MSLQSLLMLITALAGVALSAPQQRRTLHLLQLEHYENARLWLWLRRRRELVPSWAAPARLVLALCALVGALVSKTWVVQAAVAVLFVFGAAIEAHAHLTRSEIKPLVYTARARRILMVALGLAVVLLAAGIGLAFLGGWVAAAAALLLIAALGTVPALQTVWANSALRPWERHVNNRFVRSARAQLAAVGPRVIGVTGSYGKTTTKVCIGGVLDASEPTLITPASFNSYLGIVRTINERLEPEHRDFVVEMGMYRAGDIAELCELVHPSIGVITAIGPAHLERMGSIEAIRDAKAELALALPADGHLITNADDPRCMEIAARSPAPVLTFALVSPEADVRAENLRIEAGGTLFDLVVGGERVAVRAGLLGEHNVANLLAAAAVGYVIGMSLETIAAGLATVQPPEHRLQPLANTAAGVVVIDDAYNSNPAGAAAALKVLAAHPGKRRILVTPGMVELGEIEDAENERFGRLAAAAADHVILVGPRHTAPIRAGLEAAGFDPAAIEVVHDIGGATQVLAGLTRAGDVVLFENDLPDLYAEADAAAPAPASV